MTPETRKTDLTANQGQLVAKMQWLNFGHIDGLHFLNGDPLFEPPPRIIREFKFVRENGSRPEAAKADFALKAEVIDLFAQLEALGNGVVTRLEVKHGIPFRMIIEEDLA